MNGDTFPIPDPSAPPPVEPEGAAETVKRLVLFVPGYFYFTPRYFRALFAHHAKAASAGLEGLSIKGVTKGEGMAVFDAALAATGDRPAVRTRYAVLTWEALAHHRMQRPAWRRLASGLGLLVKGLLRGNPRVYLRQCPTYFQTWLYPFLILGLIFLSAMALGGLAAWALGPWGGGGWGWLAAPALMAAAVWVLHRQDRKLRVLFLMDAFAWAQSFGDGVPTGIATHLDRMESQARDLLAQAKAEGFQEAVVFGHSFGSMVGTVLADRLAPLAAAGQAPPLRLLTAGALHPLVGCQPKAHWYRAVLARRVSDPTLPWVELYAKQDPLSFGTSSPQALLSPVPDDARWPRLRTIRPREMMTPEEYRRTRADLFRFHMLYLMSSQLPTGWSFPRLALSPLPLLDSLERFSAKKDPWP